MAVNLGVAIVSTNIQEYIQQVRMLDDAGIAMIGSGDSQALYHEQFIRTALAAEHSRHARVGTWITNPITRHPAVTAAAIATVDDIAPGRAFLGVGTGDSTVYNANLRPASLATLERFVDTVRELHQAGVSRWRGKECYLGWPKRRIPIGMAVSGPRAIRLAGKIADIVWVCFGIQEEQIALAREYLAEGAKVAGRSLSDIDVWWMVQFNIAENRGEALEPIKANLATSGHIIFRYGLDGKAVPHQYQAAAQELARRYQPTRHFDNIGLTDDLGLTDYLAGRLAIAGTVEDSIQHIKDLEKLGADQLFFYTALSNKENLLQQLAKQVIPAVSGTGR